jgi:ATP-binding cassette, subfamily C, bacterial LapB
LLAGLLQPTSGRIKFDGNDISQFDPRAVRKVAAYLPQKPELFSGTVMENLTGFRKGEAEDTAIMLAEQLGLDEKIALLPGGYETQLGDTTAESLPAGTRQQIAIVRSLVTRPAIILFDEANSNLDSQDDARLRDTLATYRGRSTVVMVSHRPSMLGISDRVFRLSSGRLYPADDNGTGPRQAPPVGLEGTK